MEEDTVTDCTEIADAINLKALRDAAFLAWKGDGTPMSYVEAWDAVVATVLRESGYSAIRSENEELRAKIAEYGSTDLWAAVAELRETLTEANESVSRIRETLTSDALKVKP